MKLARTILLTVLALLVLYAPAPLRAVSDGIVTGTFLTGTTTGSVAVTGVGGTPKALLFFSTGQNTTDAVTDGGFTAIGWTDCTNQATRVSFNGDGGLANVQGRYSQSDARIFRIINVTPTVTVEATFTSCDSDGFTWNIGTSDGADHRISYIAILGSAVHAQAGTFTKPNATGSQSFSSLSFTPTLVLYMCGEAEQASADASGTTTQLMFGGGNGSQQWTNAYFAGATNNTSGGYTRTSQAVGCTDSTAVDDNAAITSLDANGWTLDWTNVDSTTEEPMFYFALNGILSFMGTDNQRTSNGTTAITGFGFQPQAILGTSRNQVSSTTVTAQGRFSFGAYDGTNESGSWTGANNGCGAGCATAKAYFTNDFIRMYTPASSGGSSTLNSAMDGQSLDADGFTINWTTTDATAREWVYLGLRVPTTFAVGAAPLAPLPFCCQPGR